MQNINEIDGNSLKLIKCFENNQEPKICVFKYSKIVTVKYNENSRLHVIELESKSFVNYFGVKEYYYIL